MNSRMNKRKITTKNMILCAFFAALTSVSSQIAIPLPFSPVPINLASIFAIGSGIISGPLTGFLSQLVFILIGAVGMPVFSRMQGGFSVLLGPTGGYLLAYPIASLVAGFITRKKRHSVSFCFLGYLSGTVICYLFGTLWFMFSTHNNLYATILQCVLPFLATDCAKNILGSLFCQKINMHFKHF
ncbi:MAG: biotin transporter BioY [Clostridia bacterium]|nr:biotin transporter BioY [Clostridia bacterium]